MVETQQKQASLAWPAKPSLVSLRGAPGDGCDNVYDGEDGGDQDGDDDGENGEDQDGDDDGEHGPPGDDGDNGCSGERTRALWRSVRAILWTPGTPALKRSTRKQKVSL